MLAMTRGKYTARLAVSAQDVAAAQRLRHRCFFGRPGVDADGFDPLCRHVLIDDAEGDLVGCYRLLVLRSGAEVARSYSAQFYDLSGLARLDAPMAEVGRFCIAPGHADPDILRIAWGALAGQVDALGLGLLFGCSSFRGTAPEPYADAFAALRAGHLAPPHLAPGMKAPHVYAFARHLADRPPDPRRAAQTLPPLLKTYLLMGGWVSDHAVIDRAMNTLHVFTALDIAGIPPARARALRAIAG